MEFQGRVTRILPIRQGVSARTGNEWKALPFVFEYFENDSDRYADSVVLETRDQKVIDNLKEGMEVVCGFGHKAHEYIKDGKTIMINDIRLYKIESIRKAKPATQQVQQPAAAQAPIHPQEENDDLPF
jgi:beta-galactosidase/beta-glucuronidase